MQNKIKLLSLVVIVYFFTAGPVGAALHVDYLNQAKESVTTKHYHKGYVQFRKLANRGCPFSQCILGIMHQNGMGVKKNALQALYWFQKSAEQGFSDAERRLGLMYYRGDGVPKDVKLAKKWLTMAAAHGVDEAKELLAQIPQIPGESTIANDLTQAPQNAAWTADNIRKAWQGYGDVTRQLDQISSAGSPN